MNYALRLAPTALPAWLDFDGQAWDTQYLSDEALAGQGWLPLVYDPPGASLGYADPVQETRDGRTVAVAYALGTPEERAAKALSDVQEQAHEARRQERTRREVAGFVFDGNRYDSDRDSLHRFTLVLPVAYAAVASGAKDYPVISTGWRDVEGVPRVFTAADVVAMHEALLAHGKACDEKSQAIRSEIDASETSEAVEALIAAAATDKRWPAE